MYSLDCGCIYYQRVLPDGNLDQHVGIYRGAEDGPCGKCMLMEETWKESVVEEMVVYNNRLAASKERGSHLE